MMHGPEKSDSVGVAVKPMNKAERSVAELVEPRTGTKGNAGQQSTRRAQDRGSVSQALDRVRQAARQRKKEQFTSLLHHVDPAMLRTAFYATKRDAAVGVDGMTWETYERDLDRQIEALHERVKSGTYRALPSRRSYIPKEDGSKRPLAVAALEDKIVQRAVAALLSAIHEEDFLGFSYGFRPKRSQHDALDALIVGISSKKVNFILDADIRSFFTEVSQSWVIRFLEHRIGDTRILRLVQKWLRAGVLEDGIVTIEEKGKIGGMDRQTLRDWVHRFNASGPEGLIDNRTEGPKPRLSAEQLAQFAKIVEAGPDREKDGIVRWRRVDLKRVIAERFGVDFHPRYVGKLLKKLGFSHISARPRHPAQDERIVEGFKKTSRAR